MATSTSPPAAASSPLGCGSQRSVPLPGIWPLHHAFVLALLALLLFKVLKPAFEEPAFGISHGTEAGVTIRDFAAHFTYAKGFWADGADYSVADHLRITNEWAGAPVGRALPFGYSPTMLWLLAPLAGLPAIWAYAVWSLLGGLAVWWMTRRKRTIPIVGALLLLSPLSLICLALGQTALLTAAALMCLALRQWHRGQHPQSMRECWSWSLTADVLLLWVLTAKPPLALVAGVALLGARRWRTVLTAVGLTVITTVLLTPWLGTTWWANYFHLTTHYDPYTADAAFAWSLRPDHMSNLRSMLGWSGTMSNSLACKASTFLWLSSMPIMLCLAISNKIRVPTLWALSTLSYLLFCPHVTSTEDLHLVVLVALIAVGVRVTPFGWATIGLVLAIAFLAPGGFLAVGPARSTLIFAAKLLLVGLALQPETFGAASRSAGRTSFG